MELTANETPSSPISPCSHPYIGAYSRRPTSGQRNTDCQRGQTSPRPTKPLSSCDARLSLTLFTSLMGDLGIAPLDVTNGEAVEERSPIRYHASNGELLE
ncbi:hypothetical protein FRC18_009382 [Serendipita sp. 400]|nr:hypothetical protein FRC18_009382 [Serendipita sp. 400]